MILVYLQTASHTLDHEVSSLNKRLTGKIPSWKRENQVQSPFHKERFKETNISFVGNHITEYDKVECLGYQVEFKLIGEDISSKELRKINAKSKSLNRKFPHSKDHYALH